MTAEGDVTTAKKKATRGAAFRARVDRTGLSSTQFAKRLGITRNVYYNLSIGQELKPEQKRLIEAVFPAFFSDGDEQADYG